MSTTESAERFAFAWREASAMFLLLAGLGLIALSLVWPAISSGPSAWTDEKALAYQAASAKVHSLSMQAAGTGPEQQTRELHDKLADAQTKYVDLRAELDAARSQPARLATILRYSGILLLAAGVIALLAKRRAESAIL
jgi:hypothetical protein